jgi:NADPH:quinone reductase-like Zn-dependent oxidoreductase
MSAVVLGVVAMLAVAGVRPAAVSTMRGVVLEGGVPVVRLLPVPEPGPGQVRVRVHAAGVNPVDWKRAPPTPRTPPGIDAAGVVDRVGSGVTAWRAGDAVIVFADDWGTYADYVVVPADDLASKPPGMSFAEAAGIPTVAFTAWNVLVDQAKVGPGMRVLIHGGAGGVGSAAVQIAKARGARVLATASTRNQAFLRDLGVDEPIDYTARPFEQQVRDLDVVVNTVDAETAARSVVTVKKGGLLLSVAGPVPAEACAHAGIRCAPRGRGTPLGEVLRQVAQLHEQGRYRVNIDARYPLEQVADAWAMSRTGRTRGKVVLVVAEK